MKKIFSIFVAIVAVGCAVAQAQGISTDDVAACGTYLAKHPMDTIVSKTQVSTDTVKITRVFLEGGQPVPQALRRVITFVVTKPVTREVKNQELEEALDDSRVRNTAQFLLSGATNDNQYDIYWIKSEDGDIMPVSWAKKRGLHLQAGVGASLSKGNFSPTFSIGALYDREKWGVLLEGDIVQTKYSSAAERAEEKYWTCGTQATLRWRPFQLDANDVNRLFVYGGVRLEWYKTDSRKDENGYFKSGGNYLGGVFGIGFTHRFFGKAQDLGVCFEYHTSGAVRQNESFQNYGTFVLKVTYLVNLFPNKVVTKVATAN